MTTRDRSRNSKRRGMTLIELMVVATVSSILLSIIVCFLVGLQRQDRRVRGSSVENAQLFLFGNSLRADIRSGSKVTASSPQTLTISGPGERQIEYALQPDGCLRSLKQTDGAAGQATELFTCGGKRVWKLETASQGRYSSVIVALDDKDPQGSIEPAVPFVVCAAVGADLINATP